MAEKSPEFSARLNSLFKEKGLNPNRFANVLGIKTQNIYNYLKEGRIPEAPILYKIAQALGVSMEWLLTGNGE